MIEYIDARHALNHAYAIRARGEALRGTLGIKAPGGDWTAQEWLAHASFVIKGMEDAAHGPYRWAIQAYLTYEPVERERAVSMLAPRVNCPSRSFNAYSLARWAEGSNDRQDWEYWMGITGKARRTLSRWQKDCAKQAKHFMDMGLDMATDHFVESGICQSAEQVA